MGCGNFKLGNNIFFHEGTLWSLCKLDYFDYWENTEGLQSDYKDHDYKEWR